MKRALLALILALPLAVSAQFRIVGTGLFTTINDSTYRAKIDFRPDLTGNSYNPTQLNDSMLVLSQKGQLYRLDSFYNASFSSAFIIVVEKNGNWGSPVGQVMVFQNNSSSAAPQAVYGANGATAGMQAGVDTWNALLLKVVSDSAVYWNQAYSNSIDSLNVSGDSLKTITLYRASGDSISATFVDGGGSGGGGGLTMPFDSVTFNVNETDASLRELKYSEEKGYLQYGGQDSVQIPILPGIWYVRNDTSVTIPKGTVLRATGTLGASGRIKVKHMIADGSIDAMYILGIAMHDIAVGADGYAMSQGKIRQVNTQAYSEGAVLYADVDTLGGLTQTKPTGSNLKLPIAFVVHSASNGTLAVRVSPGTYLRDLHDAEITSPATNASLYYNAAQGIWRDTTGAVLTSDTSVFARDFQISGTTNYLAKFTGSNTVGNSGVFESGGNVGIGIITVPYAKLNVNNSIRITDGGTGAGSDALGGSQSLYIGNDGGGTVMQYNAKRGLDFWTYGGSWQRSVTLDSTGKLGIGTNAPVYKLHVDGEAGIELFSNTTNGRVLNFRPSLPASKYIQSISAEDLASVGAATGLSINAGGGVAFSTNSSTSLNERMRITNTGNVGIGTASPGYKLSVAKYTSGTTQGEIVQSIIGNTVYSTVGQWAGLSLGTYADKVGIFAYDGYNNFGRNDLVFAVASGGNTNPVTLTDEKMRILNNGNVGIATSSPSRPLHVAGTTAIRIPVGNFAERGTSGAGDIRVRNDTANLEFHNGTTWQTVINNSDTSVFARDFQLGGTTNYLQKSTGTGTIGNSKLYENPSGSFAGYVGWNTTTVNNKFQIGSVGSTGYAGNDFVIGNGSQVMAIEQTSTDTRISTNTNFSFMPAGVGATGNVGIGTSTPSEALDVNGVGRFRQSGGAGGGPIEISDRKSTFNQSINWNVYYDGSNWKYRNSDFGASIGFNNSGDLLFYNIASGTAGNNVTAFRERLRINENGNVGIATSSPSRPLHVNSNISMIIPSGATGTRPASAANGDIRYNTSNANFEWYSGTGWREPVNAARSPAAGLANRFAKFDANGLLDTSAILIQANNRIGIFNSPAAGDSVLTVTGGSSFSGGVNARNYTLVSATGSRPALGMYSRLANRISFATNDTLRFEILAAGTANLSAAVTSPTAPAFALTVNGGGIQARNYLNLNGDSLANSAPQITVANTDVGASGGYVVFQKRRGGSGAVQNGDEVGTFSWGAKINATAGIFASAGFRANVAGTVTDTFAPVDFTIFTSPRSDGSTSRVPVKTDRLTIKPSGRVGINTASPSATLHVNGNLSRNAPKTVTTAHTVDSLTNWIICDGTAAITLTLPAASSWTGREIMVKTIQPYAVNSATSNVVPIDGVAAGTAILPATDGAWCTLVSDGTNWIIMQRGT